MFSRVQSSAGLLFGCQLTLSISFSHWLLSLSSQMIKLSHPNTHTHTHTPSHIVLPSAGNLWARSGPSFMFSGCTEEGFLLVLSFFFFFLNFTHLFPASLIQNTTGCSFPRLDVLTGEASAPGTLQQLCASRRGSVWS